MGCDAISRFRRHRRSQELPPRQNRPEGLRNKDGSVDMYLRIFRQSRQARQKRPAGCQRPREIRLGHPALLADEHAAFDPRRKLESAGRTQVM